jgi:CHAT domain-containing protein
MNAEVTKASARVGRSALVVFLLAALSGCRRQESASEKLQALAPHSERPIEARLSGFDWQAMRLQRATPSGLLDPARLDLAGAASTVIQSLANDPSARARHEAGAAYLLIDHDREAVDALESAVQQSPKDAAYWNDLAAARYTLAVREKRPHEFPQALADADHALKIEPTLPDALFNRALIIEALGITEAARRAWQRYEAVDTSTHWSNEATNHLGRLGVVTSRDVFQRELDFASGRLRAGDKAPIVALARNYPLEARTWSEAPLLGNWADAVRAGKTKTAAETLSVVRELGLALAEINHDESVADAVAAIDRAAADPARFWTLAGAHAAYRDGRLLYHDGRVADAQKQLHQARDLFAGEDRPMEIAADYYLANCLYDSNEPVEASRALDELITRFDAKRYTALAAEIDWERSLCHGSAGEWDAAIHSASEARKAFSGLGETAYRGEMDLLLAGNLDHASQPTAAWKARIAAFPVLSRAGSSDRIRNSLISAVNAERAQGRFAAALALTQVALEDLRHARKPITICMSEAARAETLAQTGDSRAARIAVQQARQSVKAVQDTGIQRRMSALLDIVEGVVERGANPGLSLRLLDRAVSFYTSEHRNAWLPAAYLERGRTRVRATDDTGALADFEDGLREIEAQRSSINNKDLRGTFYDTEPELFSETIALLLRQGDTARAFEFSDGARARSVYERLGSDRTPVNATTAEQLRRAIPPKTTLVEYALLHDSLVIFYFSSSRSGVVRVAASHSAVGALVERCDDILQHRGDLAAVHREAAALHRLLIAPVSAQIAGAERLIIVPDRQLHAVPWAALYDAPRARYLVDDFAVSVAPSAGAMLREKGPLTSAPVLVVGDPHDEGARALPEAAREAEAIAAIYASSTLLEGERATRARFLTAAQRSGMIHYAGHAESDSTDPFGALHLVGDDANRSGDLDASAIAALHLSNGPLVVLAACGTMRGDSGHVEGMPSIARAFLAAGARGVVGTLWEVDDDAVAPLFQRLHIELHNGANPSAALRTAQIALAHSPDPRLSHPATWAPVELLGYSNELTTSGTKRSE